MILQLELLCDLLISTCAAVEGQLGGRVELLDQELGEGNSLICVQ